MRTRRCAMMRRPACSIIALIAPVRLRAVASGLMMENVRSTAIDYLPHVPLLRDAAAYSGRLSARQARVFSAESRATARQQPQPAHERQLNSACTLFALPATRLVTG